MRRAAIATLGVTLASAAQAETPARPVTVAAAEPAKPAEPKPAPPDEIADVESREANLESKEPRSGLTFAASLGLGIMIGGDIGVGRGPAGSFRLGHVATRKTIITFEVVGTGALHKPATSSDTLTDNNIGLFAGAQRYTSTSFWVRASGGLAFLQTDVIAKTGTGGDPLKPGIGGLVGGGLDIARWGYLVLGFEGFGLGSLTREGVKLQLAFNLGLTYY